MNTEGWPGEWIDQEKISRKHTVWENTQKHLHAHTAAQHDQLDRVGEVTPIVAVLDNRWEENLSTGERRGEEKRGGKKSLTVSLLSLPL